MTASSKMARGMLPAAHRVKGFDYAIRALVSAAERLERAGRQVTYLNIGDPQIYGLRPPAHLTEAVARALRDEFTGYAHSQGLWSARCAVADYSAALGSPVTPDEVFITAGASEAADLILTALVNEGDEVLLPAPGYPLYTAILNKLGGVARYYHLDAAHDWQPDADEIRALINQRTRAVILINPNNPTGAITSDATTRRLLEIATENNLLVISDEVYRELCFDTQPTPASVIAAETATPLITLESLSKTHLVPGWRVGWMRLTNAERLQDLSAAILKLAGGRLCAPTPAQYAVAPALTGDRTFQIELIETLRRRRDYALGWIDKIDGLTCAPAPAAAFYMMLQTDIAQGANDADFVLELLEATACLTVHGSGFGASADAGYFRLVYLPDETTLGEFFKRLQTFLAVACEETFASQLCA